MTMTTVTVTTLTMTTTIVAMTMTMTATVAKTLCRIKRPSSECLMPASASISASWRRRVEQAAACSVHLTTIITMTMTTNIMTIKMTLTTILDANKRIITTTTTTAATTTTRTVRI